MREPAPRPREDAAPALAAGDDGVDPTLLAWMRALTPTERLQVLQSSVDALGKIEDARTAG